ncbi:hypothetical protein PALO_00290 [Cutibacterium avidum 44067]|nr:hypothetical protein PALO_00290 [Cutibacterium avidum 44067]
MSGIGENHPWILLVWYADSAMPLVAFAVLVVAAVTTQRTCGARRRGQQTMVAESSRAPLARI